MNTTTLRQGPGGGQRPPAYPEQVVAELRAIRIQQEELHRLLDEFAGSYLNARFPHGNATDRWRR